MKKLLQCRMAFSVLCAVIILLLSCSKDRDLTQQPGAIPDNAANAKFIAPPKYTGSLMLMVLTPRSNPAFITTSPDPVITITNDGFTSKDFYLLKDGYSRIDKVPAGIYTIFINAYGCAGMTINDVKIANGFVTNLGTIKLE